MKTLAQTKALQTLKALKTAYQTQIQENFEHKAKDCLTCPVQGSCCTDAHFVNVHITRLEAVAIKKVLKNLGTEKSMKVFERVEQTIEEYDLNREGDFFAQTYACPLFEKGIGCLVHREAKPAPCIQHACYENKEDLPPDRLQTEAEVKIEKLNKQVYRKTALWLPLPVWLSKINPFRKKSTTD